MYKISAISLMNKIPATTIVMFNVLAVIYYLNFIVVESYP